CRIAGELACMRIALVPRRTQPLNEDLVGGAFADPRDESRPEPSAVVDQPARFFPLPLIEVAPDGDLDGGRRPESESHALPGNEVGAHGRMRGDVVLRCRHRGRTSRACGLTRAVAGSDRAVLRVPSPWPRVPELDAFPDRRTPWMSLSVERDRLPHER